MEKGPSTEGVGAQPVMEVLDGIAGSPGVAIGKATVLSFGRMGPRQRQVRPQDVDVEMARFKTAVQSAAMRLRHVSEQAQGRLARSESSILEAYIMMLEDDSLHDEVGRLICIDHRCAEWAVSGAVSELADQIRSAGDAYLSERSHDIEFIGQLLQQALSGRSRSSVQVLTEPCIIAARDLSPAETAVLDKEHALALVTEIGTRTSHTAILARALEIPAVVGVTGLMQRLPPHETMIVDGLRGRVVLSPTPEVIEQSSRRAERHRAMTQGLQVHREAPAVTRCGTRLHVRANIELPAEATIALSEGAEGIGLYRTEFLYINRLEPPREEEQVAVYRSVLEAAAEQPVTFRTFDIGGDKFVSSFQAPPEMNPALGLRAVRLGLAYPQLFLEQLRALVRASAHGHLQIMIPMISGVRELQEVRKLLDQAIAAVDRAGQPRAAHIPLGTMIEVPSAAIMARELGKYSEFFSIGTNDLVQYALAVDRTSRAMAELASPFDPAILRLIEGVTEAATATSCPVNVCGAMASDPMAAVLLVGLGIRELSMEASAIAGVKAALGRVSVAEAEQLASRALEQASAEGVDSELKSALAEKFRDLVEVD